LISERGRKIFDCKGGFVRRQKKRLIVCAIEKKGKCGAIVMRPCSGIRGKVFNDLEKNGGMSVFRRENCS
jgi:hypothetical protein